MYSTLLFDLADGIARITINRPDKLNALNASVIGELADAAGRVEADADVRGVLLTGAGTKAFVAGADIAELAGQSPFEGKQRSMAGQQMMRRLERCGKPVIAAVNGFALGGGCELAMQCDVVIAADTAKFGQPEIKLGVIPGIGGTQRLTHAVGKAKAMDLILTGRMMDAAEAEKSGLVTRVVPAASLMEEAMKIADTIANMSLPSVLAGKEAVNRAFESGLSEGMAFERRIFHSLFATEDQKEGMKAFVEKRAPKWKNK